MGKREGDRARSRERERRARGNRKYGQAPMKHAKRGVLSCVIAGIVLLVLGVMIWSSYRSAGNLGGVIGGLACVVMLLAIWGVYYAHKGFREREKNYLTCKIGMGCNIVFLVSFIAIFLRGLFS